jgi:hypothetical protein
VLRWVMSASDADALAGAAAAIALADGELEVRQADLLAKAHDLDRHLSELQIKIAEQRAAIEAAP